MSVEHRPITGWETDKKGVVPGRRWWRHWRETMADPAARNSLVARQD